MGGIMRKIVNFFCLLSLLVAILVLVIRLILFITSEEPIYNFVDLQIKYKNYIVANKYKSMTNDTLYLMVLKNPITEDLEKVYVKDYLYINTYFVGDTVK